MEGNGRQSAKEKEKEKEKEANRPESWTEIRDRILRDLRIHAGFRSGGD